MKNEPQQAQGRGSTRPSVSVAQLGARMHYAVPRIFAEEGRLDCFFTDTFSGNKRILKYLAQSLPRAIRPRLLSRFAGRDGAPILSEKVISFDWFGLRYKARRIIHPRNIELDSLFANVGREFGRLVGKRWTRSSDMIWCFNGAALEIFEAAKKSGILCILEQTMAPNEINREYLRQEQVRWPGWSRLPIGSSVSALSRREIAEWKLADIIVCPSQFVVDGIAQLGGPVSKCRIVPYGVEPSVLVRGATPQPRHERKLRVLFCGEVGLRKGAPYLLTALKVLGPNVVEAKFAGQVALEVEKLEPFHGIVQFLGAVPRSEMAQLFAWADVLVLPSLCEGSATVVYEAICAGLPVICTPNSGAPPAPCIHIVPPQNVDALVERLLRFRDSGPPDSGVPVEVIEQFTISAYKRRLIGCLDGL